MVKKDETKEETKEEVKEETKVQIVTEQQYLDVRLNVLEEKLDELLKIAKDEVKE